MTKKTKATKNKVKIKARCTEVQKMKRLVQIEEWLLDGHGRVYIIQNARKLWDVREAQVDHYIKEIKENWVEFYKNNSQYSIEEAINKRLRLFEKSVEKGDLRGANTIHDSIDKIKGIFKEHIVHALSFSDWAKNQDEE